MFASIIVTVVLRSLPIVILPQHSESCRMEVAVGAAPVSRYGIIRSRHPAIRRRLLAASIALLLAGCAAAPRPANSGPKSETIAVIGRGWHTELGLSVASLSPTLALLAAEFPGAKTLTFGFGDRAFVLARHRGIGDALGALLPNPGLILLTVLATSPEAAFGKDRVIRLQISRAAFAAIATFIWKSFATNGERLPEPYGHGPYPGSFYYAARVPYDAFYTCNTWVAAALRGGGVPVQATGVLFASQIMREARRVAQSN